MSVCVYVCVCVQERELQSKYMAHVNPSLIFFDQDRVEGRHPNDPNNLSNSYEQP